VALGLLIAACTPALVATEIAVAGAEVVGVVAETAIIVDGALAAGAAAAGGVALISVGIASSYK